MAADCQCGDLWMCWTLVGDQGSCRPAGWSSPRRPLSRRPLVHRWRGPRHGDHRQPTSGRPCRRPGWGGADSAGHVDRQQSTIAGRWRHDDGPGGTSEGEVKCADVPRRTSGFDCRVCTVCVWLHGQEATHWYSRLATLRHRVRTSHLSSFHPACKLNCRLRVWLFSRTFY